MEQKIQEDRARSEEELRRRDEEAKGVRETLRQIEALVKKRDEETAAVMQKRDEEVKALKEVVEVMQAADPGAHRLWQSQDVKLRHLERLAEIRRKRNRALTQQLSRKQRTKQTRL